MATAAQTAPLPLHPTDTTQQDLIPSHAAGASHPSLWSTCAAPPRSALPLSRTTTVMQPSHIHLRSASTTKRSLILSHTTSGSHHSSQSSLTTPPTSLPVELVLIILELLENAAMSESSLRTARYCLSACSQTCRQWAARFQPLLFRRFTLRNEADLRRLLRLSASPDSRLMEYIEHLEVQETVGSVRWAQNILPLLPHRLPRLSTIVQRTTLNLRTGFSDHSPPLPILLPVAPAVFASGFRTVRTLHLKNYKYRNFHVLIRYLGAFSGLEEVHFLMVTWADGLPSRSGRSSLKICSSLTLATASSCTDNLAILSLFALSSHGQGVSFGLSPVETPAIMAIANVLRGPEDKDPLAHTVTCIRRSEGKLPQLLWKTFGSNVPLLYRQTTDRNQDADLRRAGLRGQTHR